MKIKICILFFLPNILWAASLTSHYEMGALSSAEKLNLENYKNLKTEYDNKSYDACYKRAQSLSFKDLSYIVGLRCLVESSILTESLLESFVEKSKSVAALSKEVSSLHAKGLWALMQKKELSKTSINKFESTHFLNLPKKELAKYYNFLANEAILNKNLSEGRDYYLKSLAAYNDRKLRKELIADGIIDKPQEDNKNSKIEKKIKSLLKTKKIKEALVLFSSYSESADNNKSFRSLQKKISKGIYSYAKKKKINGLEKELSKNSAKDLSVWAYRMMKSHKCLEALYLAELGIKNSKEVVSEKNYNAAYYSSVNCQDYKKAYYWTQFWQKNTDKYAEAYKEALLKKGFASLRNKKWSESNRIFKELSEISENSKYRLPALYWSWRSEQKLNSTQSKKTAAQLIKEYPLTYYGLRAHIETQPKKKIFVSDKSSFKIKLESEANKKLREIILSSKAGWKDESKVLLSDLLSFKTAEERLVESRLWTVMENPIQAIIASTKAWEIEPSLTYRQAVKNVFPKKYYETINKYSIAHEMNPLWVLSLIRQESAFQEKGKSSAGALGLMQLMPPTAREMGRRLKVKLKVPSSLWKPKLNIRLGSKYLKQMLSSMDGHLPLALASYNAGIGNIKKWKAQREDVNAITNKLSSDPLEELWIEELHWSETRFYVKAILRNYMIYSFLYEKKPNFNGVIWQ